MGFSCNYLTLTPAIRHFQYFLNFTDDPMIRLPTIILKVHIWVYRRSDDHFFCYFYRRSDDHLKDFYRRSDDHEYGFLANLTDDPTITIWIFWWKLPTIRRSRFPILYTILAKTETLIRRITFVRASTIIHIKKEEEENIPRPWSFNYFHL